MESKEPSKPDEYYQDLFAEVRTLVNPCDQFAKMDIIKRLDQTVLNNQKLSETAREICENELTKAGLPQREISEQEILLSAKQIILATLFLEEIKDLDTADRALSVLSRTAMNRIVQTTREDDTWF